MRFAITAVAIGLLIGCASYNAIDTGAFRIGMTKSEAQAVMDNRGRLIGAKEYEEGIVEVISVTRLDLGDSSVAEEYWLYFFDGRLEKWGRPGDWQRQADQIYEVRVR